jgi:uncharacterized protein (DUF1697 family)
VRYVALLRGINVGGRNRVQMADLRQLLTDLGFDDVSTYLASGNAIFTAPRQSAVLLAEEVAERIAQVSGIRVKVLIRTAGQLAAVLRRNPLGVEPADPSRFFVAFLSKAAPDAAADLMAPTYGEDRMWVSGAEAFLWCPGGFSALDLLTLIERRLGVAATTRTWNTVKQLVRLTGGFPGGAPV